MSKIEKLLGLGVLIAIIVAVLGINLPGVDKSLGATVTQIAQPSSDTTTFTNLLALSVNNGGITDTGVRVAATAATTSPCSIQNPSATATTSLVYASANFTVSSTTASVVTIGSGTNSNATTTFLASVSIAANAQGSVAYYSTTSVTSLIAPNAFVNFGMQGGTGTFSPTATCEAKFRSII